MSNYIINDLTTRIEQLNTEKQAIIDGFAENPDKAVLKTNLAEHRRIELELNELRLKRAVLIRNRESLNPEWDDQQPTDNEGVNVLQGMIGSIVSAIIITLIIM